MTPNAAPLLQADAISLGYSAPRQAPHWVLQDFHLTLAAGELVVLLGPSGVGKSSLLRVLAGLQAPQRGRVQWHGQVVTTPQPQAAFVFQQPSLLPWLDVRANVALGLDFAALRQVNPSTRAAQTRQADAALAEVGLTHAARLHPNALSGGMAQRVALARALARQPQLLLLDEPFSALDEVTRADMQSLLRQLVTRHRSAAVLVTHDIDEALTLADRILLIGGSPGRLMGQWTLTQPFPRHDVALELNAQRLEILQTLRNARASAQQSREQEATVEYVI